MNSLKVWLAVVLSFLAVNDTVADWPQFRGPSGQGICTDRDLPVTWSETANVLWRVEPGAGGSTPIIIGSRIFLTSYSGYGEPGKPPGEMSDLRLHVACLDLDSGKEHWRRTLQPRLPEQERIREDHGYATPSPTADTERVYAFFGKSGLFAFDHDGKQLWHADVGSTLHGWGCGASLMLAGENLIVNASVESEALIALNRKTGKEAWRASGIKESWNTPVLVDVGGKSELVLTMVGKVLAFDPATGEQLWSCATDIGWYMVPSVVASDGVVYCIGGRSGGGLAVRAGGRGDVTATHRLWTIKKGSNVSSPVVHRGHLYWMHENLGIAYCADVRTGNLIYEERIAGADQVYAAALIADERIYYVTRSGRTIVVAAKPEFERLAMNSLGRRQTFNASPAAANGRLLLRSDRMLYCLGKPRTGK